MRSKLLLMGFLVCGLILSGAQMSHAAIATGSSNTFTLDYNDTNGYRPYAIEGAKNVNGAVIGSSGLDAGGNPLVPAGNATEIYSFCAQIDEYFSPPDSGVYIKDVGTDTQDKASGSQTYWLTGYASWVYSQFLNRIGAQTARDLGEDTYGVGGDLSAFTSSDYDKIQNAIWAGLILDGAGNTVVEGGLTVGIYGLVGDLTKSEYGVKFGAAWSDSTMASLDMEFSDFAAAVGAAVNDIKGVRVAHLQDNSATPIYKQDQLVLIGEPHNDPRVPEPTTLVIWSLLGGVGFGFVRRRA